MRLNPLKTLQVSHGLTWRNPKVRALVYQVSTITLLLLLCVFLGRNIVENLRAMSLPFGFGFLNSTAGFDIGWSIVDYQPDMSYWRVYWVGITNTLILSFLIIVLSTLIGFLMGIVRLTKHPLLSLIARTYIEIFRNIPLLIQIIFWYLVVFLELPKPRDSYSLGESVFLNNRGLYFPHADDLGWFISLVAIIALLGFSYYRLSVRLANTADANQDNLHTIQKVIKWSGLAALLYFIVLCFMSPVTWNFPLLGRFNLEGGAFLPSAFCAALIAMSIYRSVTIAEMVRAGILSVDSGQQNAAQAIGFTRSQTLRFIILPQSARSIIPPLINAWLTITKESSLAVAIGFPELVSVFMQTSLNQTGRAIEVVLMVMGFYVLTSLFISILMNYINQRMQIRER